MRRIAVFNAGPFRDNLSDGMHGYCRGDNDALFARTLGVAPADVVEIRIREDAPLPEPADISAVVVTGSAAMVTDRHPWAERAAAWIAEHRDRVPMLGVCFGNQLLAHALGGVVDWTPEGPEYGTVEIEVLAPAARDPVLAGVPTRFAAQAAHSQRVAKLPRGAKRLAENGYGLQAARYSELTWGLQFHPEYDRGLMDVLLSSYRAELGRIGVDVPLARSRLAESPVAARVLPSFAAVVREREAVAA